MKILLMTAFVALCAIGSADAQSIDAGANVGLGLPFGDMGDVYDPGFSWNVYGLYNINDQVSAGLEIGGTTFSGEVVVPLLGTLDLSFTLTEILVVGNYVFLESDQLRVGGGLGAGFYANDGGEEIGVSPRVFARYMVTNNIGLSAQIPVNLLFVESSNFNYAGFRVGAFYRIDM